MTAAVRTIRKLDDLPEIKTIRGVVIEKGVPIPRKQPVGRLDEVLLTMEVGESFVHTSRLGSRRKLKERVFTTRQLGPKKFRIWRMK